MHSEDTKHGFDKTMILNKVKTFKSNIKIIVVEILPIAFFTFLIFLFDKTFNTYLVVGLLTLLIVYIYVNSKITEISISENELFVTERGMVKTKKVYLKSNIKISYEQKLVGKFIHQKILRIYNDDFLIAKLKPTFSGWNKESINNIYKHFSNFSYPKIDLKK